MVEFRGMVSAVEGWGDQDPRQGPLEAIRNRKVGMHKEVGGVGGENVEQVGGGGGGEQPDEAERDGAFPD